MIVHIRLREELQRRSLSAHRVMQEARGRITPEVFDALASGKTERVDLETLGIVASALERASGQPVNATDLLEFQPEAALEIQPFHWDQIKQYTDSEADDFIPMLKTLRDRDRQIEAARFPS